MISLCSLLIVHLPWCLPKQDQVLFHFSQAPGWKLHHYYNRIGRPLCSSAFPFSHLKNFFDWDNLTSCPLSVQLDIQTLIHLWMNCILIEEVLSITSESSIRVTVFFLWHTFIVNIYTWRPGRSVAITLHPLVLGWLFQIAVVYDIWGVGRR